MKNLLIIAALSLCFSSYAQKDANSKFQIGIAYSLTNENFIFNNPISASINYQIKKWDNIAINAGISVLYFPIKQSGFFTDKWAYNPNISASYNFKNSKFGCYFALGYYYDSRTNNYDLTDFFVTSIIQNITINGVTFAPGAKYFVSSTIFIDANLTLLMAQSKDNFGTTESANNAFFNIGLGVAF